MKSQIRMLARKTLEKQIYLDVSNSYYFLREKDIQGRLVKNLHHAHVYLNAKKSLGYSKKSIRDMANIGTVRSNLGSKCCNDALKSFQKNKNLSFHFISDADEYRFLKDFYKYVQKLDMECNGKSHNRQGESIVYRTVAIVWGGSGNQVHHGYYQFLGLEQHQVTIDFLTEKDMQVMSRYRQHDLFHGFHLEDIAQSIQAKNPTNHIELSPKILGALVAMYEYKNFTKTFFM